MEVTIFVGEKVYSVSVSVCVVVEMFWKLPAMTVFFTVEVAAIEEAP